MEKHNSLKVIFWLAVAGAAFSGTLTIQKLSSGTCLLGEACQQLGPLPACAYGLFVYLLIMLFAGLGLKSDI